MPIALDANLGTAHDSVTLTTTATAAPGSRIILTVSWYGNLQTITTVSGGGLTWVVDRQFEFPTDGDYHLAFVSAYAASGLASGTVITVNFSAGPDFGPGIAGVSFTGLASGVSGYVDVTSTAVEDFNQAWTSGNLVTTNANDLLFVASLNAVGSGSNSNTPTAPASEIHDFNIFSTDAFAATEYRIVSSTSTYTLSGNWLNGILFQKNIGIAYKAALTVQPIPQQTFPVMRSRW